MKILHLFPYLPTPPTFGGALRVYHILRHLANNHDVTVAGFNELGNMKAFEETFPELQNRMYFYNPHRLQRHRIRQIGSLFTNHSNWYRWAESDELQQILNNLFDEKEFDIVLSEFSIMGRFELQTDATNIIDAHNVEYDNYRRMSTLDWSLIRKKFYKREYEKVFAEETDIFSRQQAIFSTSQRDSDIIKRHSPQAKHFVIPNGVDTSFFQYEAVTKDPFSMVFTGAMGYVPNNDGMNFFLEKIFPLIKKQIPEAKIYIVGNNPPPMLLKYQSDDVIITGFVDDVRPYINRASVYVVPLNMGSGTRLKVVEAMSMKKPIVSTSIGCEGIDVVDNEHLMIKDEPAEFAEAVVELMKNQALCNRLTNNGYELVHSKYDWHVIGEKIDKAFNSLKKNGMPNKNQEVKKRAEISV